MAYSDSYGTACKMTLTSLIVRHHKSLLTRLLTHSLARSINQSINQSINRSVNQSMDGSVDTLHTLNITFVTARKLAGGFVCVLSGIQ